MKTPPDDFARFAPAHFADVLANNELRTAVLSVVDWHPDAPNPLIVLADNGGGKTTFMRFLAQQAGESRPDRRIHWLTDRSVSLPSGLDSRMLSAGERILESLEAFEVQSADLLLVDDAFVALDNRARSTFLERLLQLTTKNVQVVVSASRSDWLTQSGRPDDVLIFPRGVVVRLDPRRTLLNDLSPADGRELAVRELEALKTESLPDQAGAAPRFETGGSGPIRLSPEPPPIITEDKVELYEELVLKARDFLAEAPSGSNRTARVRNLVEAFAEQLGSSLADIRPNRLWSKANTLRRLRDADLRTRRSPDPDGNPLPELVVELLDEVGEEFNVFAIHDEALAQIDASSLGPRDRAEVLVELEAGRVISRALAETPGMAEPAAVTALAEAAAQGDDAMDQTGINADQAIGQSLATHRNGAIALLAKAVNEVKSRLKIAESGAWTYAGEEGAKLLFANFVKLYEKPLTSLLARVQGADVAAYVLRLLRQLLGG